MTGTAEHRQLALWAAQCAENVLPLFVETEPGDDRPGNAIAACRSWVLGEISVGAARSAAFAAHAAARSADDPAAVAAARSAAHAAATAHVARHARHAAAYARRAAAVSCQEEAERKWQLERLPRELRPMGFPQ